MNWNVTASSASVLIQTIKLIRGDLASGIMTSEKEERQFIAPFRQSRLWQ